MTLKNVNFGVVENFNIIKGLIYGGVLMLVGGCSNGSAKTPAMQTDNSDTAVCAPFDADSAYAYVARQVAFGPRVPGSESHAQCARYLADQLARFGADTVIEQTAELPEIGKIHNIMGRYSVHNPARVLLLAHWDTRPWADEDPDPENHSRPIDGANDGGSGVGVLLELSRQFGMKRPDIGVDILLLTQKTQATPAMTIRGRSAHNISRAICHTASQAPIPPTPYCSIWSADAMPYLPAKCFQTIMCPLWSIMYGLPQPAPATATDSSTARELPSTTTTCICFAPEFRPST